jgi:hypothetical protein
MLATDFYPRCLLVRCWVFTFAWAGFCLAACAQMAATGSGIAGVTEQKVGYDQVREVLRKRCVTCHNIDEMRGDLDLSDINGIMAGSASGPVVMAGQAEQSTLYLTAAHVADPVMPPNSPPIPDRELELLRRWIDGGLLASSESDRARGVPTTSTEPTDLATALPKAGIGRDNGQLENASPKSSIVEITPVFRAASITALVGHPTQPLAAVGGHQQIILVDTSSGLLLKALEFPEGDVTAVQFSRDGKWLVAGGGEPGLRGRVIGFDIVTGQRVFELGDETDTILGLDVSPDKQTIALGGPSKVVRVLRIRDGAVVRTLRKHTDWIMTLRFSPDGLLLASADRFGGLIVWNSATGEVFHELRGHVGPVNKVEWDITGETLISGGEDSKVRTWNMHHGQLTSSWDGGVGPILDLESRSGMLAVAGRSKKFAVWRGPELMLGDYPAADQVECISFAGEMAHVIAGDALGNLHLVNKGFGGEARQLKLPEGELEKTKLWDRMNAAVAEYLVRSSTSNAAVSPVQLPSRSSADQASAEGSLQRSSMEKSELGQARTVITLELIDEKLAILNASKSELEQMQNSTNESVEAMVAALANLHMLQKKLESHRQSQAELLKLLEAERAKILDNDGDTKQ